MKTKSTALLTGLMLVCCLPVPFAQADMKAHITYDRGVSAVVENPSVIDNAVILPRGALPFRRISRVDFDFGDGLTMQKCETLFKEGAFDRLEKPLTAALKQADPFVNLPGNLDVYLTWQMKVQFWNGRYAEMNRTADLLRQRNASPAGLTGMYTALALIEQKRDAEAAQVFAAVDNAEAVSAPMALFVRARLAMAKREYRQALQHLARIVVSYDRDPEWMPAATFYEGLIDKRTGCLEAAGSVAKELIEKYPDGYWSRRAAELK